MEAHHDPREDWGGTEYKLRNIKNLTDNSEYPPGEWNNLVKEFEGREIKVWVNGDLVNYGYYCAIEKGQIAVQAESSEVEFRKILLTCVK